MKISVCLERIFIGMALMLFWFVSTAHAEMASVYDFHLARAFAFVTVDVSQFALTIAALGSGVGILI